MVQTERLLWMDYIKIFSTLLIVMQHSISTSFTTLPVEGIEWKIINFVFMLSRIGIPIFIMCSGAGMLAKERSVKDIWRKNILNLLIVYVGWMLVYGLKDALKMAISNSHNIRVIINAAIKPVLFGMYHTWFIIMLIGMYMLSPLLYEVARKELNLKYFIFLSVLFTTLLPMLSYIKSLDRIYAVLENFDMHFVIGYSMYFMIGYYFATHKNKVLDKYVELIFLLSAISAYVLSCYLSVKTGHAVQEPYQEFSPLALIINVSFFLLFQKYFGHRESLSDKEIKIASLERFGIVIYLVHVFFIIAWTKNSGLIYFLYGLLIWFLSLVIGIILEQIPILNKILILRPKNKKFNVQKTEKNIKEKIK